MSAPSVDIAELLQDADISPNLTIGTNLYVGIEPEEPDDTVTVFDTPGRGIETMVDPDGLGPEDKDTVKVQYPSVQVRVRNQDYRTGHDLATAIMNELHGKAHVIKNSFSYELIRCIQTPALLDWDKGNRRARFVVTFDIIRRASS